MQPLSSTLSERQSGTATGETENLLRQAVEHGLCVRVIHRRATVLIAQHILYMRGDALFLDGVTLDGDSGALGETGLDTFRLTALKSIAMTSEPVAIHPAFDRTGDRYRDNILVAIEP